MSSTLMYSSEYTLMYRSEEKLWWYIGLRDLLGYYFKRHGKLADRVLDVGCGTGKNMEFLIEKGYRNTEGIDYSPEAIDFCHKRNLHTAQLGSITAIPFPDESFDIVYCMDVIGCLDPADRELAASELMRVLKPGGLFLVNSASLKIFRSQHDDVGNLKIRFNKKNILELFQNYNIQLHKLTYRVFLLSPLVLTFKAVKNLIRTLNPDKKSESDQVLFPNPVNWVLTQIQLLENFLLKRVNIPFGSSVFMVFTKGSSKE